MKTRFEKKDHQPTIDLMNKYSLTNDDYHQIMDFISKGPKNNMLLEMGIQKEDWYELLSGVCQIMKEADVCNPGFDELRLI